MYDKYDGPKGEFDLYHFHFKDITEEMINTAMPGEGIIRQDERRGNGKSQQQQRLKRHNGCMIISVETSPFWLRVVISFLGKRQLIIRSGDSCLTGKKDQGH